MYALYYTNIAYIVQYSIKSFYKTIKIDFF